MTPEADRMLNPERPAERLEEKAARLAALNGATEVTALPRVGLVTSHWFREGPIQPDGSDGYWICGYRGCGRHRSDHVQYEGHWLLPLHTFVPQRTNPVRCRPCGWHWLNTIHTPWAWDHWETPEGPK